MRRGGWGAREGGRGLGREGGRERGREGGREGGRGWGGEIQHVQYIDIVHENYQHMYMYESVYVFLSS